jgi:transcriptional regulator with XRE-family HTH domain
MTDLQATLHREFGARVRQRRGGLEMTQTRLARMIGTTPNHMGDLECGRSMPTPYNLVRLAIALDTNVEWLLALDVLDSQFRREMGCAAETDNSAGY